MYILAWCGDAVKVAPYNGYSFSVVKAGVISRVKWTYKRFFRGIYKFDVCTWPRRTSLYEALNENNKVILHPNGTNGNKRDYHWISSNLVDVWGLGDFTLELYKAWYTRLLQWTIPLCYSKWKCREYQLCKVCTVFAQSFMFIWLQSRSCGNPMRDNWICTRGKLGVQTLEIISYTKIHAGEIIISPMR